MQEHYLVEAHKEWDHARRKAFWSGVLNGLRGKRLTLLNFADISHRLHLENALYRGLQTVPLDRIQAVKTATTISRGFFCRWLKTWVRAGSGSPVSISIR